MQQISNINPSYLSTASLSTDITTGKRISKYQLIPIDKSKSFDNDSLFEELSDLTNPQFRGWYCKMFYKLGRAEVLKIASIAKADGKDPKRLFSMLLKKAVE